MVGWGVSMCARWVLAVGLFEKASAHCIALVLDVLADVLADVWADVKRADVWADVERAGIADVEVLGSVVVCRQGVNGMSRR